MLAPKSYEVALPAEKLRGVCYQIAAEAHLAWIALLSVEDYEQDTTLLSLSLQLHGWEETLEAIAGGSTFDRFGHLEEAKGVQS